MRKAVGVKECPRNRGSESWTERRLKTELAGIVVGCVCVCV